MFIWNVMFLDDTRLLSSKQEEIHSHRKEANYTYAIKNTENKVIVVKFATN